MVATFREKKTTVFLLVIFALVLSFATVSNQVNHLTYRFVKDHQDHEHTNVMNGVAGNPWQYRILADYMLEPYINFFAEFDQPKPVAFISFRFLQNFFIFIAAFYYYKKLGFSNFVSFLGIGIFAWMVSQSVYHSDLAFSTYFDVLFYLLGGLLLLNDRYYALLSLMLLAVFNRETIGMLIVLLPVYVFFEQKPKEKIKEAAITFVGMSVIYLVVFFGLRQYFGEQVFIAAYDGFKPGKQFLYKNVVNLLSWQRIAMTVGIIPFLALLAYPNWNKALRIFFWTIVPVWGVVHFTAALVAETRLFLVPLVLVFIPAALTGLYSNVGQREN